MPDKRRSADEALAGIDDGHTILSAGFGDAGRPNWLLERLRRHTPHELTVVSNNGGKGNHALGGLMRDRSVKRLVCSFPTVPGATEITQLLEEGAIELDLVPQGVLTERLRAAAAGVTGFYLPAPVGTPFHDPAATREINGIPSQFYEPLPGDVALIKADVADTHGNAQCRLAARNFNPVMARAARVTVLEVDRVVAPGTIPPDQVHIMGLYVDHVVLREGAEK